QDLDRLIVALEPDVWDAKHLAAALRGQLDVPVVEAAIRESRIRVDGYGHVCGTTGRHGDRRGREARGRRRQVERERERVRPCSDGCDVGQVVRDGGG